MSTTGERFPIAHWMHALSFIAALCWTKHLPSAEISAQLLSDPIPS